MPAKWYCECRPYQAKYSGHNGPKLLLVHNVSCDKPYWARRTVTYRLPPRSLTSTTTQQGSV